MSALFKKSKKGAEETVLIVDVESGSVAAALAVLAPGEPPKLFAEHRIALLIAKTLDAAALAQQVEKAAREVLSEPALFAARLRNAPRTEAKLGRKLNRMGQVGRAALFFAPPWATLEERRGTLAWTREAALAKAIRLEISAVFGDIPIAEYSFGEAASGALYSLFEQPRGAILCTVTGEVAELLRVLEGSPRGYATIPTGARTLVRTLGSHAGLSAHEARSLLVFAVRQPSHHLQEPLDAMTREFCKQFGAAVEAMGGGDTVHDILVFAPDPWGEWFAQALSRSPLPLGGEGRVRALHPHHLSQHVATHTASPDLTLMVETAFMGTLPAGVY